LRSDVSIVLSPRDTFSTLAACVGNLLAHTDPEVPILAVIGGAPEHLRQSWLRDFGERVSFHFEEHFQGTAAARNWGLVKLDTPLAVAMDTDVFVRPGWLEPLLECQAETDAMLVVPLMLERPRLIHCAGNDLYVTRDGEASYGHKVLRLWRFPYVDGANLTRERTDYGELHCQLVKVADTLRLGAYDEKLREVGEVDSGLVWAREGELWFEPRSVVHFVEDAPLRAEDVEFYAWRWDMREILEGYRYFAQKWGFDITESGDFKNFLVRRNARLGLLPRRFPSELSLRVSGALYKWGWRLRRLLGLPVEIWEAQRRRALGYDEWPTLETSRENQQQRSHPTLEKPRG